MSVTQVYKKDTSYNGGGVKNVLLTDSGTIFREAVDTVESAVVVNLEIDQTKTLKKFVHRVNFVTSIAVYRPVDSVFAVPAAHDADSQGWTAPIEFIGFETVKPISNLGVVVGQFVTAIEFRFHALKSILFEGGLKYMVSSPRRTWRYAVINARKVI